MISVVIPTLDAAATLPRCLNALFEAAMSGLVREVIVVDGGSTDETIGIADAAGARIIKSGANRGLRLRQGADAARSDWLLFLHANTILESGWATDAASFIERSFPDDPKAAAFAFALDEFTPAARRKEAMVAFRGWLLALPYGDQGLLIPKRFYRKLGGFKPLPNMEDVDLVRRIGRRRLVMLRAHAATSGVVERKSGFARRVHRTGLLLLHALRVPAPLMTRLYG
jgi:glycosyltransferase involved in cell wall biosynthesis